ncbi:MAG: hypothetical protein KME21_19090 [Desmonostoc vinosum HA7617-LM4]|jgi:hypothetical protein|nr:hypothetical protein [Desmonostoc vinosum HA7617-LM4]
MKVFRIVVVALVLLFNLVIIQPSLADDQPLSSISHPSYAVGQKVVWLYKARADSNDIQRIPAEVVKIGSKKLQIKVRKNDNEFVNRWVNLDKLENSHQIKE